MGELHVLIRDETVRRVVEQTQVFHRAHQDIGSHDGIVVDDARGCDEARLAAFSARLTTRQKPGPALVRQFHEIDPFDDLLVGVVADGRGVGEAYARHVAVVELGIVAPVLAEDHRELTRVELSSGQLRRRQPARAQ